MMKYQIIILLLLTLSIPTCDNISDFYSPESTSVPAKGVCNIFGALTLPNGVEGNNILYTVVIDSDTVEHGDEITSTGTWTWGNIHNYELNIENSSGLLYLYATLKMGSKTYKGYAGTTGSTPPSEPNMTLSCNNSYNIDLYEVLDSTQCTITGTLSLPYGVTGSNGSYSVFIDSDGIANSGDEIKSYNALWASGNQQAYYIDVTGLSGTYYLYATYQNNNVSYLEYFGGSGGGIPPTSPNVTTSCSEIYDINF